MSDSAKKVITSKPSAVVPRVKEVGKATKDCIDCAMEVFKGSTSSGKAPK
jgi:hypothetical protein